MHIHTVTDGAEIKDLVDKVDPYKKVQVGEDFLQGIIGGEHAVESVTEDKATVKVRTLKMDFLKIDGQWKLSVSRKRLTFAGSTSQRPSLM
jgi:hypothetical protein